MKISSFAVITSSLKSSKGTITSGLCNKLRLSTSFHAKKQPGLPKGYHKSQLIYNLDRESVSGLPDTSKPFTVLGIESSCDDTGVAIVRSDGKILSNVVISQNAIHQNYGGIVPSLAMEAHKAAIDNAVSQALAEAGLTSPSEVDAIAVTKGPGLELCLRIGLRKAQALAKEFSKPFVTVHHLEAHCFVARLAGEELLDTNNSTIPLKTDSSNNKDIPKVQFPFLALLASGGHTSIVVCKGLGDFQFLGGTIDDSLGEALDKAARLMGLIEYSSGGVAIETFAKKYIEKYSDFQHQHRMKVPLRQEKGLDFSYSGLKTSFLREVKTVRALCGLEVDASNAPSQQYQTCSDVIKLPENYTSFLSYHFQNCAFQHIEDRLLRAINFMERSNIPFTSLVVVGGVAANQELRRRLLQLTKKHEESMHDVGVHEYTRPKVYFPPIKLCTDNGVMVAWAGIEKFQLGISNAIEDQEPISRWPLGPQYISKKSDE